MNLHVRAARERRGTAMVMTLVSIGSLATMSVALVAVSLAESRQQRETQERLHATYVAEAGLNAAVVQLQNLGDGNIGNQNQPATLANGSYWVTATTNAAGDLTTLTATGLDDRSGARLELTVHRYIDTVWRYAAFGDDYLTLDSNAGVDSYNSDAGTYASQAVNNNGSNNYANTDGDIGSNGNVSLLANAKVWGDATCGPSSSYSAGANTTCTGNTTPAQSAVDLPPLVIPSYGLLGNLTVNGSLTKAAGNYEWGDFVVKANSTFTISGPANIVCNNFKLLAGAQFKVDATNGPVTIYVHDNFTLASNTEIYSTDYLPKNVRVQLESDNVIDPGIVVDLDTIDFNSNAKLYGTIYAPNALVDINSNFEVFGAIVARQVLLRSNTRVHYDETLAASMSDGQYVWERVAWRELPYQHP